MEDGQRSSDVEPKPVKAPRRKNIGKRLKPEPIVPSESEVQNAMNEVIAKNEKDAEMCVDDITVTEHMTEVAVDKEGGIIAKSAGQIPKLATPKRTLSAKV
jgi:hypothetical protein